MGRIVIDDGVQRRSIDDDDFIGEMVVRIDLSGTERSIVFEGLDAKTGDPFSGPTNLEIGVDMSEDEPVVVLGENVRVRRE